MDTDGSPDAKNVVASWIADLLVTYTDVEKARIEELKLQLSGDRIDDADIDNMIFAITQRVKMLGFNAKRENVYRTVSTEYPEIKKSVLDFDTNDYLFNVANCTLDLSVEKLLSGEIAYEPRQEDLITRIAPVVYDPECQNQEYVGILFQQYNGDMETVNYHCTVRGIGLTGHTMKAFFLLLGDSDTGKSAVRNVEMKVYGDLKNGGYAKQIGVDTLLEHEHIGELRADLVSMRPARIVYSSELKKGAKLNEEMVKNITGEDDITCRGPFMRSEITYKPKYKIVMLCNDLPYISSQSEATLKGYR